MFKRIADLLAAIYTMGQIGGFDPPDAGQADRIAAARKRTGRAEHIMTVLHLAPRDGR